MKFSAILKVVAVSTIAVALGATLLYAVTLLNSQEFEPDFEFDEIEEEYW